MRDSGWRVDRAELREIDLRQRRQAERQAAAGDDRRRRRDSVRFT
jgi:hypothetical protein